MSRGRTRRVQVPALAGLLALLLAGGALADERPVLSWPAAQYNPKPAAGDVLLPLPCGGAMAFRVIVVGPAPRRAAGTDFSGLAGPLPLGPGGAGAYLLGKYEVTRQQAAALQAFADGSLNCTPWQACAEAAGCPLADDPKGRLPRGYIAWGQARLLAGEYGIWLARQGGTLPACAPGAGALCVPRVDGQPAVVRLPTGAEWEYAARGGQVVGADDFAKPDAGLGEALGGLAWTVENSRGDPLPIGGLAPNALDLHDLFGNVAELLGELDPGDPARLAEAQFTARGGAYNSSRSELGVGAAVRAGVYDGYGGRRTSDIGVRLVVGGPLAGVAASGADRDGPARSWWAAWPSLLAVLSASALIASLWFRSSLRALFSRVTCPVCQHYFRLVDAPFHCENAACHATPRENVIPPPGLFARSASCPICSQATRERICPGCHRPLPHDLGQIKQCRFVVIGDGPVGRSHYITAVIARLASCNSDTEEMTIISADESTRETCHYQYKEVYEHRHMLSKTPYSRGLHFHITVARRRALGLPSLRKSARLVLVDMIDNDLQANHPKFRTICRADGIILLVDPMQMPKVCDALADRRDIHSSISDPLDLLERISRVIRSERDMPATAAIPIPLAVAISKLDVIDPLLHPGARLLAEAENRCGFDVTDSDAVSREVEALIARWHGDLFLTRLNDNFRRYRFFGVSPLGCNFASLPSIPRIMPRRVEDPLLWLLSLHGVIPSRRKS